MVWATESRRRWLRTTTAILVVLAVVVTALWQVSGCRACPLPRCLDRTGPRCPTRLVGSTADVGPSVLRCRRNGDRCRGRRSPYSPRRRGHAVRIVTRPPRVRRDRPACPSPERALLAAEQENTVVEQRRHERQRSFFANAAHALRTPITIARGHTEMAMQNTTDPDVKADLMIALEELDRLTRAAERNLRLSVVGEVDHHSFRPVDTGDLVRTTVERWKPTAQRAWSAETRGETGDLLADSEQLTEALDALIENALLATTSGDSIVVRSEVRADAVVLVGHRRRMWRRRHRPPATLRAVRAGAPTFDGRVERNRFGASGRACYRRRSWRLRRDGEQSRRRHHGTDRHPEAHRPATSTSRLPRKDNSHSNERLTILSPSVVMGWSKVSP